jgi:hypothetical protein
MLVFRDGRETVSGPGRLQELTGILHRLSSPDPPDPVLLLDALLRAGELECALADAGCEGSHARLASVTDALATALVQAPAGLRCGPEVLAGVEVPSTIELAVPEGFAFYSLHPLDYADLAAVVARGSTAVVGIRSIGTTLSAVVTVELRRRGIPARRKTVRPVGHPFDRRVDLDVRTRAWLAAEQECGSEFWVVDEGPGLSGSSFLAVGEALERAGVPRERIHFLCSVDPRKRALCARDAAARWARFQTHLVAPPRRRPAEAAVDISGGKWRQELLPASAGWPASWTQFERLKYLSADRRRMYKFEGFGRFGAQIAERARVIAEAGFGVPLRPEGDGYYSAPMIVGCPANAGAVDQLLLERLAAYCAFRSTVFRHDVAGRPQLEHMMAWNYFEEFGTELAASQRALPVERPVIADGRMQPHEWIAGTWLLKTDSAGHGDDHFFPGPTDIAWDLAGAIVEWRLPDAAAKHLLERYRVLSGDDARPRIESYRLAYTLFRMGYCKMAAEAMRGSEEGSRLDSAYQSFRRSAQQLTQQAAAA